MKIFIGMLIITNSGFEFATKFLNYGIYRILHGIRDF